MENSITALDLHYLVSEFQVLIGSKVDKIYQPKKKEFLFQFYISNEGKKILRILIPDFIYLTDFKEVQETPMEYCKFLRKYLNNSKLKKITQKGFERILELRFETKEETLILLIELFSRGNLILCREDYTIMSPLERQSWAAREVKARIKYKFPEQKKNLFELKEKDFIDLLKNAKKDKLVAFLAIDLSLGGKYAEKIISDLKFDKNENPKNLNEKETKKIFDEIGNLINKKEKINEFLDKELTKELIETVKTVQEFKYSKDIGKIQRIIDEQKETIERFKKDIDENNKKAEVIYANYKLIEEIIIEINKAKEKYSWQEIKEKLKGHKLIKELNLKDKTVFIEIN